MANKTYQCAYTHCKHNTKEINPKDDGIILSGSRYWHKDCLKESLTIREIIDMFYSEVNKNVVMSQLRSVVNNLVYNKGNDAEFIKFGLRYYLDHNIPINYPQGLYYVVQSKEVQEAWGHIKAKQAVDEQIKKQNFNINDIIDQNTPKEPASKLNKPNKAGFSSVLGRS